MSTLDRKRSYGQVYGQASHAFEQDGKLFDNEGKEVGGKDEPAEIVEANKEPVNPVPVVQALSVAKATLELPHLTRAQLDELAALENTKEVPRKGLLAAIDIELADRPPADEQLNSQLKG